MRLRPAGFGPLMRPPLKRWARSGPKMKTSMIFWPGSTSLAAAGGMADECGRCRHRRMFLLFQEGHARAALPPSSSRPDADPVVYDGGGTVLLGVAARLGPGQARPP